jgi:hypothetical protein
MQILKSELNTTFPHPTSYHTLSKKNLFQPTNPHAHQAFRNSSLVTILLQTAECGMGGESVAFCSNFISQTLATDMCLNALNRHLF